MNQDQRVNAFRKSVELVRERETRWARQNSWGFLTVRALAVALGCLAAAMGALPERLVLPWQPDGDFILISKWATTLPLAIAAALFIAIRQLRATERATAHHHRSERLDGLLWQLDYESSQPPSDADLARLSAQYRRVIEETAEDFAAINIQLGAPPEPSSPPPSISRG